MQEKLWRVSGRKFCKEMTGHDKTSPDWAGDCELCGESWALTDNLAVNLATREIYHASCVDNLNAFKFQHDYDVDQHGMIVSPGKFEMLPEYVIYYYGQMLDGWGHDVADYGPEDDSDDDESVCYDEAEPTIYTILEIADRDVLRWSDLAGQSHIILYEDSQGFIHMLFVEDLTDDGKEIFKDYL